MDAIINSMLQVVLFNLAGLYQAVRQDFNLLEIAILVGLLIAIRRRGFADPGRVATAGAAGRPEQGCTRGR